MNRVPPTHFKFVTLTDAHQSAEVLAMMRALYREDEPDLPVDQSRFPVTIDFLLAEPSRGRVILVEDDTRACGYAILIPYWSNEYGGTILYVDELYVLPESRNRGIGHQFFDYLRQERPFDAVAVGLEVSPSNARGRRLYESLGFRSRRNATLMLRLTT